MVSQDGDKRMALIAALIAIPAACLVAMLIHIFVPVQKAETVFPGSSVSAHGHHGGMKFRKMGKAGKMGKMDPEKRAAFKKKFAAARKARQEQFDAVVKLAEQQLTLLKKDPKACPAAIAGAKEELLLAQSRAYCNSIRLRPANGSISELAVKTYAAKEIEAASQTAFKAKKISESALLKSRIRALKLELELTGNHMFRNPQWQESYRQFLKTPNAANLKAMLDAEKEMMPPRRF